MPSNAAGRSRKRADRVAKDNLPAREMKSLVDRLRVILMRFEALNLDGYLLYINDPKLFLWRNFIAGVARGLGGAIGFTILGAAVVALLSRLTVENVPVIGDFLAEIVEAVQRNMGT